MITTRNWNYLYKKIKDKVIQKELKWNKGSNNLKIKNYSNS